MSDTARPAAPKPQADKASTAKRADHNADHNAQWDAEQAPWPGPRHHANEVRDRGILDALGRAVSAPALPERGEPGTGPDGQARRPKP